MARRPTKLEFYEHPVTCPYCGAKVIVTSLMERILAARRNCPVCKREMFIDDGRALKMPGTERKETARRTRSRVSKAKD
jgi:hypothetical protein